MGDKPGIPEGFTFGYAWETEWVEDSYAARGHSMDLTVCPGETSSWGVVPPPTLGVSAQAILVFSQMRSVGRDVLVRRGTAAPFMPPAGGFLTAVDVLVAGPRTSEVVAVTEVPTWPMLESLCPRW